MSWVEKNMHIRFGSFTLNHFAIYRGETNKLFPIIDIEI